MTMKEARAILVLIKDTLAIVESARNPRTTSEEIRQATEVAAEKFLDEAVPK